MSLEGFNPVAAQAVIWTQQQLTPQNLEFLRDLPQGPVTPLENLQCVHGSPRDEDEYVLMRREAYSILGQAATPLIFFGHTHVQGAYWIDDHTESEGAVAPAYASARGKGRCALALSPTRKYLINPGSIGQPRDGDPRAAFALYDTEASSVIFHRVPYDVVRAQKKIIAAGLPHHLAARLAEGR
jgi:diadenosine tetraphosphatase ApaH/serine/threonine PP2A family protein phosphatase